MMVLACNQRENQSGKKTAVSLGATWSKLLKNVKKISPIGPF